MKKPTSKDVAKIAGVSQSTVSFVLNNRTDISISDDTRERVIAAAKKLNYVPNLFAKGLKTNQSKLFGLLVPTVTNPYYPMLTQNIEEYSASKGYNVLLCNTYRQTDKEEFYLNLLTEKSVDGIIYEFTPQYPNLVFDISKRIPVVIIGEKEDSLKINTIGLNSFKAGELIAQHLVDLGHEKIAFISTPLSKVSLSREKRLRGIISKLKEHKIDKNLIIKTETEERENNDGTYEIETGYKLMSELLNEATVTAVIGVNDMVAFGALNAISHAGLRVPEDISVCGFDNIYLSKMLNPKITTVDHYTAHRSKLAVDIMIDMLSGNSTNDIYRVEYEPRLVIRESTSQRNPG